MKDTLEMMKNLVQGYEKEKTICELLLEYKEHQAPNVLAFLFVKNYGLIVNTGAKYTLLDDADVASFSLQELDKCILVYDETQHAQFSTFFCACLRNRLRHEQQLLACDLKFANYNVVDISECNNLYDDSLELETFDFDSYGFTYNEKNLCKLLLDGYSVNEISKIFNLSPQAIYYRNKIIGKKILNDF